MNTKKQFGKNLAINGINFLVNISLGLLMTPFLVKSLGISTFGIVQLAISMSTYTAILSTSLNQSNNRFISIAIANNDTDKTKSALSTILTLYMLSFVIVMPFIILISLFPNKVFDLDKQLIESASYMFFMFGISQILIMLTTAFMSPAYAKNRLDVIQGINILRNSLKLFFVFVFFVFISNSLKLLGLAFLLSSIVAVIVAFYSLKKFVPFYYYKFVDFDWIIAKKILHLSGWTIVSVLGGLMFLQTDIVLINIFLGAKESGHYALLLQWSMLMISITIILSIVISPMILNKYAQNKTDELKKIFYKSIKFQGIYTAIPVGLLFVYADTILVLWIGEEYRDLAVYLQLMIFHFGVSQATRQLLTVNTAYNKMKWQGVATILFGLMHILVSMYLLKYTNLGLYGIILSNVSFTLLLNLGFLSFYTSRYLNEKVTKIYYNLIPAIAIEIMIIFFGYFTKSIVEPNGWVMLMLSFLITFMMILPFIYFFIFNKEEKLYLIQLTKKKV